MESRLYRLWRRFVFRREGSFFALLYNITYGYRKKMRLVFDSENLFISTSIAGFSTCIYLARPRSAFRFRDGVEKRLDRLFHEYFLDIVPIRNGDIVVDVGANIGEIGLCYQLINKKHIRYIYVEPETQEIRACSLNNPGQIGISGVLGEDDAEGRIKIYHAPNSDDTSIIKARMHSSESFCDIFTLKSVLKNHSVKTVRLMKLEAEGAELEVLRGAKEVLPNIEYIAADLGPERGYFQEHTVETVTNFLLQNGFDLLKLNHPGRLTCLFKNRYVDPQILSHNAC